jgi:hypothetical protein
MVVVPSEARRKAYDTVNRHLHAREPAMTPTFSYAGLAKLAMTGRSRLICTPGYTLRLGALDTPLPRLRENVR